MGGAQSSAHIANNKFMPKWVPVLSLVSQKQTDSEKIVSDEISVSDAPLLAGWYRARDSKPPSRPPAEWPKLSGARQYIHSRKSRVCVEREARRRHTLQLGGAARGHVT